MSPTVAELTMMNAAMDQIVEKHTDEIVKALTMHVTYTIDKVVDEHLAENWPESITSHSLEGCVSPALKASVYRGLMIAMDRKREEQREARKAAYRRRTA
jgi:hypothetical protein